jgi:protein-S-isoprenylcysteine O-methyltransferase Ste14
MYFGVMLMFFNLALITFTLFAVVSLHLQILQEEKYLAVRFGEQYTEYKSHVFRYLGRKQELEFAEVAK